MNRGRYLLPPTIHLGCLPDEHVVDLFRRAQKSIRFVGPGMTASPARVLTERWMELGPTAVEVVLDADPDLCRLGYCDEQSLDLLRDTASRIGAELHMQPGIRLCVLEIDSECIVFPPTPRLLEEPKPNTAEIILSPSEDVSLQEQIFAPAEVTPRPLTDAAVQNVKAELKRSPPQPFDLARQVRVLSTHFQFVEFSLQKAALHRKRVPVPPICSDSIPMVSAMNCSGQTSS